MSLLSANLTAFQAIAKTGTVQAAAKELGLTQTGVTQRTRSLEANLGATLFTRSRRGMRLTGEGEALLRYCQAAAELEGETLAKITGAGLKTKVRVVIQGPTSVLRSRVIPQIYSVIERYPELLISFDISDSKSGAESLRSGATQLAVIPPEQVAREMDSKLMKPEQYVLVCAKDWKKRALPEIIRTERIIDFDPTDTMTQAYLKKYRLLEMAQGERHFVNNNESLVEMFKRGLGYGVLAREFAQPHLADLHVLNSGQSFENKLALAWYPRPHMRPYFRDLVGAVR